jgi:chromosome segregation ATPase
MEERFALKEREVAKLREDMRKTVAQKEGEVEKLREGGLEKDRNIDQIQKDAQKEQAGHHAEVERLNEVNRAQMESIAEMKESVAQKDHKIAEMEAIHVVAPDPARIQDLEAKLARKELDMRQVIKRVDSWGEEMAEISRTNEELRKTYSYLGEENYSLKDEIVCVLNYYITFINTVASNFISLVSSYLFHCILSRNSYVCQA